MQGRARRVLLALLTAVFTLAAIELVAFAVLTLAADRLRLASPQRYVVAPERVRMLAAQGFYDPELGWSHGFSTPYGERPHQPRSRRLMAAFGDSFVYGDEIEPEDTWEEALAAAVDAEVLNLGVSGYGIDQALLSFRSKAPRLRAPIVVLGFPLGNIGRVVNSYRPFYFPKTGLPLPKPHFVLRQGRLELRPNPVTTAKALEQLSDPAFIERMSRDDFWYSRTPRLGFPYTALVFDRRLWKHAFEVAPDASEAADHRSQVAWSDDEARRLFFAIMDAFAKEVRAIGSRPLILLLPDRHTQKALLTGEPTPGYQDVLAHLREGKAEHFDGLEALRGELDKRSLRTFFTPGGHLSPRANAELARKLERYLRENGWISG